MHGDDAEHEGGGEKDRTGRRAVVTAEAYVVDTGRRRTWPMLMAVPLVSSSRPLGVTVAEAAGEDELVVIVSGGEWCGSSATRL